MGNFIFDPLTGEPTILSTARASRPDQTGAVQIHHPDVPNVAQAGDLVASNQSGTHQNSGLSFDQHHNRDQRLYEVSRSVDTEKPKIIGIPTAASDKPKVDFFAKGNESMTPEAVYQDADNWNVRVVPNKYPIIGDHEVLIHSPDPSKDIDELSNEQVTRIIRAYLNRLHFYTNQDKEVFIFSNRGHKAGASLEHPHSQIIALKGFPGTTQKEKESALRYYDEHNTCYWCDEVKDAVSETDPEKSRVVLESAHFVALVPKACRWSYEVRLTPKTHRPNFGFVDEPEINDFAAVLKKILQAYGKAFNYPDRNFWIHTQRYDPFHWHLGFLPHIKVFGALELGAGIWVSDKATPETAAELLRANLIP